MDELLNIKASKAFSSVSEELTLVVCEPTWHGENTTADDLSI
jgi:hypothetical protein